MKKRLSRYASRVMVVASAFALLTPPAWTAQRYGISNASVSVHCPMTVGGSFQAKTTALAGELALDPAAPGMLEGSLSAELSSIDTGVSLRNRHLREKYLEVDKAADFATATLTSIQLDGPGVSGLAGEVAFKGLFTLHGEARAVSGQATLTRTGEGVKVEASFPVHIPDYNIKKPRYMGVGVKDTVTAHVTFDAVPLAGEGQ